MNVGIESIDLYAGRFSLDIGALTRARGKDPAYVRDRLLCEKRSVYPDWEDSVTLAVNAARRLFECGASRSDIGLVIVGTESAVDFGKPIATWVHRFCELPDNCRCLEAKHACYGSTGALMLALSWVQATGKKALVVSTDCSRSHVGDDAEVICGGCATAFVVGPNPKVLTIDPRTSGYWTSEIADTFRPTALHEVGDNQLSLYSYLDALEGAYTHYERARGAKEFPASFRKHVYHAPFPGMALQAHAALAARTGTTDKALIRETFTTKVQGGLRFAREIGSAYGSSNFLCLLGTIASEPSWSEGDLVSIFAYGSGCQGEFYHAAMGREARASVDALDVGARLDARAPLTTTAYERFEAARQAVQEARHYQADVDDPLFRSGYTGSGLLFLHRIADYRREYAWA